MSHTKQCEGEHMASMATGLQDEARKTHMYLSSDSLLTRMSLILSIFKSSPSISSTVTVESAMETTSSSSRGERDRDIELMHHWQIWIFIISKEPKANSLSSSHICSLGDGLEPTFFGAVQTRLQYDLKSSQGWSSCRYLCSHTAVCVREWDRQCFLSRGLSSMCLEFSSGMYFFPTAKGICSNCKCAFWAITTTFFLGTHVVIWLK